MKLRNILMSVNNSECLEIHEGTESAFISNTVQQHPDGGNTSQGGKCESAQVGKTTEVDDEKDYLLSVGSLFKKVGKYEQAERLFRKYIALCPKDFKGHYNLGSLLSSCSKFVPVIGTESISSTVTSTASYSNNATGKYANKLIDDKGMHQNQRLEEALRSLNTALHLLQSEEDVCLETESIIVDIYGALASNFIKLGQPENALLMCKEGLVKVSNDLVCLSNLNVCLRQLGRIKEAIATSWSVIGLSPPTFRLPLLSNSLATTNISPSHHQPQELLSLPLRVRLKVVCVKWGSKYGAEYVNKLFAGVHSQLSPLVTTKAPTITNTSSTILESWSFVCYTDDVSGIQSSVTCRTFSSKCSNFKGWWLKANVFDEDGNNDDISMNSGKGECSDEVRLECGGISEDWTLYLDLDTIICGELGFLFECITSHQSRLVGEAVGKDVMLNTPPSVPFNSPHSASFGHTPLLFTLSAAHFQCEGRPCGINSSLMMWKRGYLNPLFTFLIDHYDKVTSCTYKFDHYLEMALLNDEDGDRQVDEEDYEGGGRKFPKVCYLQECEPGRGKIVDFLSLASASSADPLKSSMFSKFEHVIEPASSISIVTFPLFPKPHHVQMHVPWIDRMWQANRSSSSS